MSTYPFREVEKRWQATWEANRTFQANDHSAKPKIYILEMLPYPSGRLHMGHVRNYTIGDAVARYKRALGFEVLHPMGWDAFGLPAENAAIEHQISPHIWTNKNIATMKEQFGSLGFSFDWTREVNTSDASYYGPEQKLFLDFYQRELAFRKESWVNWDPVENSVLANEQVINGRGWRSGALVEKRKLNQWSLRITDYAQRLLDDLQSLKGWPEKVVRMQENWIGRSEGALITFEGPDFQVKVFTTRPETLFGASFCALAPAHPLAESLAAKDPALKAFIADYYRTATNEEAQSTMEKKGYDTGLRVTHPLLKDRSIPLYVANFVLMDYGTGAIFACPAHDERDFDFARTHGLPILPVVQPENGQLSTDQAYVDGGTMINSEFLDGLSVAKAREKMLEQFERQVTYRLRDWCVSRQRYWGCPIPIIYCDACGVVPVPEKDLPVKLPEDVNLVPGKNPLDTHLTWKHVVCPTCKGKATRETDTLDTFFESSWYFLRYCCPQSAQPIDPQLAQAWMPVDLYIGGIEHAILHLLYARFFTKVLQDLGYVSFSEPFANLLTQGMVCHRTYQDAQGHWLYPHEVTTANGKYITTDGGQPVTVGGSVKMSKSKKNLIDPNEIIDVYGADAARLFIVSDTPPDRDFDWSDEGLEGCWRYLNRLWRLGEQVAVYQAQGDDTTLRKNTHQTLAKITQGYERQAFNKVIAFARELTNTLEEALEAKAASQKAVQECLDVILMTLNPIIPHITAELWQQRHTTDIVDTPWPKPESSLAAVDMVTIAVQVNGKMRGSFDAAVDLSQEALEAQALALPNVAREIDGRGIRRVIVIPNRIVNVVI